MLVGAMNHPQRDVLAEVQWMSECGFDFIDLTLEPPAASSSRINLKDLRQAIERSGLKVVGHTAYYLPLASPFEEIRQAVVTEMRRCLLCFAELGARWMNIHPDRPAPMHDRSTCIQRNLQTLEELMPFAEKCGVGLMLENLPGTFNCASQLGELLDRLPTLGLHLDIGHCNLLTSCNTAQELIDRYGSRIVHVHLHDNNGGSADLHLPLGAGTMDWQRCLRGLKDAGYDSTITLEVFSEHREYLLHSRDLIRRAWESMAIAEQRASHGGKAVRV